jgi:hypothetical protein
MGKPMATNGETSRETSPVLASVWDSYRDWAAFAREQQRSLTFWRALILSLGLGGAVLETLAASSLGETISVGNVNILGLFGFILLALAAFFGRDVLGGRTERIWVGARSVAEALKSESYKYCVRAPPYDNDDRDQKLASKNKQISRSVGALPMIPRPSKRAERPPPEEDMNINEYVRSRLDDQIDLENGYYWKAARENNNKVKKFRRVALALGAISAVLGGFGAFGITGVSVWVAVFTTVSTSVAAYFQAGRFEYLVLSYSATARRLQNLVDEWLADPRPEAAGSFVLSCEEALSFENQAWLAEWLREVEK